MTDWPAGFEKRILESTDSTMSEATRLLPDLTAPTWILAKRQTAGRGRQGKAWVDPVGNFAATLVMLPKGPPANVALRSFVAALALREALVGLTGREAAFTLKWPNDVLLNGGKLAGILLESVGQGSGVSHLSIGVGVNLMSAPDQVKGAAFAPVSLRAETGVTVQPETFLDSLAPAYARFESQFNTYGFAPIRQKWLSYAARLGEVITAKTAKNQITGTFQTVDESGALVLKDGGGSHAIAAADIFFAKV